MLLGAGRDSPHGDMHASGSSTLQEKEFQGMVGPLEGMVSHTCGMAGGSAI